MFSCCRHAVSLKKRRFKEKGYDLDLAYITERIIAMGFPASGKEFFYRNPWKESKKFLDEYHDEHYRVYNLCCESDRQYDSSRFGGRVECFAFADHQAPPVSLIRSFCESVDAFLNEHEANVVAIHCKAGKGRTGLMICAYLLHSGMFESPDDAMHYYGVKRSYNGAGVTIPSQKRFVKYYSTVLRDGGIVPQRRKVHLDKIVMTSLPPGYETVVLIYVRRHDATSHESQLKLGIVFSRTHPDGFVYDGDVRQSLSGAEVKVAGTTHKAIFHNNAALDLEGDVKVVVYKSKVSKKAQLFSGWFNTAFLPGDARNLMALREDLDKVRKDMPANLKLALHFSDGPTHEVERVTRGKNLLELDQDAHLANGNGEILEMADINFLGERPHISSSEDEDDPDGGDDSSSEDGPNLSVSVPGGAGVSAAALEEMSAELATQTECNLRLQEELNSVSESKRRLERELMDRVSDHDAVVFDLEQRLLESGEELSSLRRAKGSLEDKIQELTSVPVNDIIEELEEQNRELQVENDEVRAELARRDSAAALMENALMAAEQTGANGDARPEEEGPSKEELAKSLRMSIDKMNNLMALLKREQEENKELHKKLDQFVSPDKPKANADDSANGNGAN